MQRKKGVDQPLIHRIFTVSTLADLLHKRRAGDFHNFICMTQRASSSQICDAVRHGQHAWPKPPGYGIAPSSLQNYFDHSEPTRPVLIALARAAHVSIAWLATGRGPKNADNLPEGYFGVAYYTQRRMTAVFVPLWFG